MENYIICPNCKHKLSNAVVESAAKGMDHVMGTEFVDCECGERITFWAITKQLSDQKSFSSKFRNWFQTTFKGKAA